MLFLSVNVGRGATDFHTDTGVAVFVKRARAQQYSVSNGTRSCPSDSMVVLAQQAASVPTLPPFPLPFSWSSCCCNSHSTNSPSSCYAFAYMCLTAGMFVGHFTRRSQSSSFDKEPQPNSQWWWRISENLPRFHGTRSCLE